MVRNLFELFFLGSLLVYLFGIYRPHVRRYRRTKRIDVRTRGLDALLDMLTFAGWQLLPLVYILTPWLEFANYTLPVWAGGCGIAILTLAVWLLWRAYTDLGRNWSPKIEVSAGQTLVTSGIYGYIRHPIYAGLWLWALAQPLLLQNWIAGSALLATFLPLYLVRVPREEQMMLEHFGSAYRTYMSRTGRVFPRFAR